MRKLCARWMPRLLTIDRKRIRMTTWKQNFDYFNRNPKEFLCRFVTMDETWIHHYTPKWHEGSKQCVKLGESAPKRPKTQQSFGKVMANDFWDAQWSILHRLSWESKNNSGAYYCALLDWLVDDIKKKQPHLKKKWKSFFLMTMYHLTYRTFHRQKSMNWFSNRFRINRFLETFPPATIIFSQTSRDGCVVGVLSRTKKLNGKQKDILEGLTNRIIWKA